MSALNCPDCGFENDDGGYEFDCGNLQAECDCCEERMCRHEATCHYFYKPGGEPYEPGERFIQADLADTLQAIANPSISSL